MDQTHSAFVMRQAAAPTLTKAADDCFRPKHRTYQKCYACDLILLGNQPGFNDGFPSLDREPLTGKTPIKVSLGNVTVLTRSLSKLRFALNQHCTWIVRLRHKQ